MAKDVLSPQTKGDLSINSWTSAKLQIDLKPALQPFLAVSRTLATTLKATLYLLKLIKNFLINIPDPVTAALIAALETAKGAIDEILTTNAGHMLIVYPDLVKLEEKYEFLLNAKVEKLKVPKGANATFVNTVISSLYDELDIYRPQYPENYYVGGVIVYAGASTYAELIPLLRTLKELFSGNGKRLAQVFPPQFPGIKNLKAVSVVIPTSGLMGVQLSWDYVPKITLLKDNTIEIAEIGIERLGPADLTAKEITRFKYDGTTLYFDGDVEPSKTYVYTVTLYTKDGNRLTSGYTKITLPVQEEFVFHTDAGSPPNWYAAPGLLYLLPEVAKLLFGIRTRIEDIERALKDDPFEKYKKYIEILEARTEDYLQDIQEKNAFIQKLLKLLSLPSGIFLGAYPFVKSGGVLGIREAVVEAFSTENSPPLSADAITTGVVFVTGAPDSETVTRAVEAYKILIYGTELNALSEKEVYDKAVASLKQVKKQAQQEFEITKKLLAQYAPET